MSMNAKASFLRGKLFDLFCTTCIEHFIEHIFIFNIDGHSLVEILSMLINPGVIVQTHRASNKYYHILGIHCLVCFF